MIQGKKSYLLIGIVLREEGCHQKNNYAWKWALQFVKRRQIFILKRAVGHRDGCALWSSEQHLTAALWHCLQMAILQWLFLLNSREQCLFSEPRQLLGVLLTVGISQCPVSACLQHHMQCVWWVFPCSGSTGLEAGNKLVVGELVLLFWLVRNGTGTIWVDI